MKKGLIILLVIAGFLTLFLTKIRLVAKTNNPTPTPIVQSQNPQVISTNPPNLDGATIPPNQAIEVTFNQPLVNEPYTVVKIEPSVNFKLSLKDDNKTVAITPSKPYGLGAGYSLTIDALTKFQSGKSLNQNAIFHFKTVGYSGV